MPIEDFDLGGIAEKYPLNFRKSIAYYVGGSLYPLTKGWSSERWDEHRDLLLRTVDLALLGIEQSGSYELVKKADDAN